MLAKDRYTSIQTLLSSCGKSGCLFLCLCSIAEEQVGKPVDLINIIKVALNQHWITEQFYVNDSLSILTYLTGKVWRRRTTPSLPNTIAPKEYTVAIYYNSRTGYNHFRRRGYDTLTDSITVKEGSLMGYYIYEWSYV